MDSTVANRIKIDEKVETVKSEDEESNKPSEFVQGIITFVIFLVFMTLWMYYGSTK